MPARDALLWLTICLAIAAVHGACHIDHELVPCWPHCDQGAGAGDGGNAEPCDDGDPCTVRDRVGPGGTCQGSPVDADGDGIAPVACGGRDCDDSLATVHPDARESPFDSTQCANGLDDDCNGRVDATDPGCFVAANGICSVDRWCWQNPLPQGGTLTSVWASSLDNLWAVGANGMALRWDGARWNALETPTTGLMLSVHGTGADDVWAVGANGVALHWDGIAFRQTTTGTSRSLTAVWAADRQQVWATGADGMLLRWEAAANRWSADSSPTNATLRDLWGTTPDDLWAVGDDSTTVRWDGDSWSALANPLSGQTVRAVWGTGPTDLWAVGDFRLAMHWNGTIWQSRQIAAAAHTVHDIGGTDADHVFAVDDLGSIFRWDGASWAREPLPARKALHGVAAVADQGAWAVGADGLMLYYDRALQRWGSSTHLTQGHITALWVDSVQNVWTADDATPVGVYHWDGSRWSVIAAPPDLPAIVDLWSPQPGELWALGPGELAHYDGGVWQVHKPGTVTQLNALWGAAGSDLWLCGSGGTLLRFDGEQFMDVPSGTTQRLEAIWGTKEVVWVVGNQGTILRGDPAQATFESVGSPIDLPLRGIWGRSKDDVWAVGAQGTILHWNGSRWLLEPSPTREDLNSVWAHPTHGGWAVGGSGVIVRTTDTGWRLEDSGVRSTLSAARGAAEGSRTEVWVTGALGATLRRDVVP